eukprot:scaffold44999_cov19-Tisochrysis_lutea.AAC.1
MNPYKQASLLSLNSTLGFSELLPDQTYPISSLRWKLSEHYFTLLWHDLSRMCCIAPTAVVACSLAQCKLNGTTTRYNLHLENGSLHAACMDFLFCPPDAADLLPALDMIKKL